MQESVFLSSVLKMIALYPVSSSLTGNFLQKKIKICRDKGLQKYFPCNSIEIPLPFENPKPFKCLSSQLKPHISSLKTIKPKIRENIEMLVKS